MLQKELKEVKDTVEGPSLKKKSGNGPFEWKDIDELIQFGQNLNTSVEKMNTYLRLFNSS